MEKVTSQTSRREFIFKGLLYAGLGAIATALAWIFEDVWTAASRFSSSRWVPVVRLDQIQPDITVPYPEYKIAILSRDQKIGAISLECTHLGCLVNVVDRGFFCPCHGSDFGPLGQVYSGPATVSLPWHEVMDRDGRIWVHLGIKLDSPQWLAINAHSAAKAVRS
jgi:nitrite reductase/ring-hydroxylating ferredoxin subunit